MHSKPGIENKSDILKWLIVLAIFVSAVWAIIYYDSLPLYIKMLIGLLVLSVGCAIALKTIVGKRIWAALDDARSEMRKIVWPTRQETIRSTGVVILVVILVSCFLWILDSILSKLAKLFIG